MGQKVHPLGFRVSINKNYKSKWFIKLNNYSRYLFQDHFIRKQIFEYFNKLNGLKSKKSLLDFINITEIVISRRFDQMNVFVHVASAPSTLNSSNLENTLEKLQSFLSKKLNQYYKQRLSNIKIPSIIVTIKESSDLDNKAIFIAKCLVEDLENRVPFRKALKTVLETTQKQKNLLGIKVKVSGRLNGIEMARSEWIKEGRIPLQTLLANIEYCTNIAQTKYGVLGVKVWVYKGEYEKNSLL